MLIPLCLECWIKVWYDDEEKKQQAKDGERAGGKRRCDDREMKKLILFRQSEADSVHSAAALCGCKKGRRCIELLLGFRGAANHSMDDRVVELSGAMVV